MRRGTTYPLPPLSSVRMRLLVTLQVPVGRPRTINAIFPVIRRIITISISANNIISTSGYAQYVASLGGHRRRLLSPRGLGLQPPLHAAGRRFHWRKENPARGGVANFTKVYSLQFMHSFQGRLLKPKKAQLQSPGNVESLLSHVASGPVKRGYKPMRNAKEYSQTP